MTTDFENVIPTEEEITAYLEIYSERLKEVSREMFLEQKNMKMKYGRCKKEAIRFANELHPAVAAMWDKPIGANANVTARMSAMNLKKWYEDEYLNPTKLSQITAKPLPHINGTKVTEKKETMTDLYKQWCENNEYVASDKQVGHFGNVHPGTVNYARRKLEEIGYGFMCTGDSCFKIVNRPIEKGRIISQFEIDQLREDIRAEEKAKLIKELTTKSTIPGTACGGGP